MSVGKPVFASHLTSLPEVGGDHVYYWRNFEPEHMVEVYEAGMKSFGDRDTDAAKEWVKQFSWESAAKAYLQLYQES
jgi:glycosyltransferase involved in cell wall biosynthesis